MNTATETTAVEPELIDKPSTNPRLTAYKPYDAQIAKLVAECAPLTINGIDDTDGFKAVDSARKKVKKVLSSIENTRKKLKEDSLAWGRMVDAEAKRIVAQLEPTKLHLESEEKRIKDELNRIELEKLEARRKKIQDRVAQFNAIRAPFNPDELNSWTDAEFESRIEAERQSVREEEERRAAEEKRRAEEEAKLQSEREELDRQRAEIAAEKKRLADAQAAEDLKRLQEELREKHERERQEGLKEALRIREEEIARAESAEPTADTASTESPTVDWNWNDDFPDSPDVSPQVQSAPEPTAVSQAPEDPEILDVPVLSHEELIILNDMADLMADRFKSAETRRSAAKTIDQIVSKFLATF